MLSRRQPRANITILFRLFCYKNDVVLVSKFPVVRPVIALKRSLDVGQVSELADVDLTVVAFLRQLIGRVASRMRFAIMVAPWIVANSLHDIANSAARAVEKEERSRAFGWYTQVKLHRICS